MNLTLLVSVGCVVRSLDELDGVNSPRGVRGPPLRMAVVASQAYFAAHAIPKAPRDLMSHRCINQRMQTSGGLYVWDFERRGKQVNVRVDGQLIFNTSTHIVQAAVAGLGVAYLPEEEFEPYLQEGAKCSGRLQQVRSHASHEKGRQEDDPNDHCPDSLQ